MLVIPFIGVTLDHECGEFSSKYSLRENYAGVFSKYGGLPLPLSYEENHIDVLADLLDGLVLTGGGFDIHPKVYGEEQVHPKITKVKEERTSFELKICRAMLTRQKPILGICGGMQLINVALGGTLIQHLPDVLEGSEIHSGDSPGNVSQHPIDVVPSTRLFELAGESHSFHVNSSHHQAIDRVGEGLRVNAYAPDGIVEGIEREHCLGIQWHPEYEVCPLDTLIIKNFIEMCKKS